MSTLAYFQKHASDLLYSTYDKLDDLGQKNVWDAASVLVENELKTRPIENERFVTRYVSIEPDEHLKAVSSYEHKFNQKYDVSLHDSKEIVNFLLKNAMIEVMPKVDLADKVSFVEFLDISYKEMANTGRFYAEPLIVGGLSEEPRYRKSFLHYVFQPREEMSKSSFMIIAESSDGYSFNYPRFGQHSAPTMLFDLFQKSDFYFSVLEKIHSKLENLVKK